MYITITGDDVSVRAGSFRPSGTVDNITFIGNRMDNAIIEFYSGQGTQHTFVCTVGWLRKLLTDTGMTKEKHEAAPAPANAAQDPVDNAARPVAESTGADVGESSNETPTKV